MSGVARDTSGDAMAAAMADLAGKAATLDADARARFWQRFDAIRELLRDAARTAKQHHENTRVPHRERQVARDVHTRCLTMLAHLDDLARTRGSEGEQQP